VYLCEFVVCVCSLCMCMYVVGVNKVSVLCLVCVPVVFFLCV
jgi:hypothetical protein